MGREKGSNVSSLNGSSASQSSLKGGKRGHMFPSLRVLGERDEEN